MGWWDFAPLKSVPKNHPCVSFDCEGTGDPEGFIMGCVYDEEGPHVFHDREKMRKYLIRYTTRKARLYAHNASYDFGILFQDNMTGWKVYHARSRFIKAVYQDRNRNCWTIIDTSNLSGFMSLEALAIIVGLEKFPTPEYLKAKEGKIVRRDDLTKKQLEEVETYCTRDTEIVYRFARFFQDTIGDLGGEVKTTIASTAMDVFRRSHLKETYATPTPYHNFLARMAYYGGRVEGIVLGRQENQYGYDVHSMYPAVMRDLEVPDPNKLVFVQKKLSQRDIWKKEGITCCTITAPDLDLPLLPVRIEGRLLFVTGTFEGVWCHNELRRALDLGYKIEEIHWQLVSLKSCSPFTDYVDELYRRKREAEDRADPTYHVIKFLLNSLSGKFGQKCDGGYTRLVNIGLHPNTGEKAGLDYIEWNGELYIQEPAGSNYQPSFVIVLWIAYVTAEARLRLYDMMVAEGDDLTYCDTDSVVGSRILPVGLGLGEYGREFGPTTVDVRAEKYYRFQNPDDSWNYRKAGVKKDRQEEFWKEGRCEWLRPRKINEALRKDERVSVWIPQPKTDRVRHFKRCPIALSGFDDSAIRTRPWTYEEATHHYRYAPKLLPWRDRGAETIELVTEHETRILSEWIEHQRQENLIVAQNEEIARYQIELEALNETLEWMPKRRMVRQFFDLERGRFRKITDPSGRQSEIAQSQRFQETGHERYGFERSPQGAEEFMTLIERTVETYDRVRTLESLIYDYQVEENLLARSPPV